MLEAIFTVNVDEIKVCGLTQWDRGQKIKVTCPDITELFQVHFAFKGGKEALVVTAVGNEFEIPDELLMQPKDLVAYVYALGSDGSGETVKTIQLPVTPRAMPEDYTSDLTPSQMEQLEAMLAEFYEDATATANEAKRSVGETPRPNLLDNWYFGNPVNQRGQTEYTGAGYTIDRWKMGTWQATNPAVTVEDGCIVLSDGTASDTSNSVYLSQYFEAPERFAGKTVTLSVKLRNFEYDSGQVYAFIYANGSLASRVRLYLSSANTVTTVTTTLPETLTALAVSFGQMSGSGGKGSFAMEIEAVKLELGDTQTLAHQDADGNWVLNEIPDYGQELAKCQRYFQRVYILVNGVATAYGSINAETRFFTPMRSVPAYTFTKIEGSIEREPSVNRIYDQVMHASYVPTDGNAGHWYGMCDLDANL